MEQFLQNIKIYKFDGLSDLLNEDYENYLTVILTEPRMTFESLGSESSIQRTVKLWYPLRMKELTKSNKRYIMDKFGIMDNDAMELINHFNFVLRTGTYDKMKLKKISSIKAQLFTLRRALTDKGLILSNEDSLQWGKLWYNKGEIKI